MKVNVLPYVGNADAWTKNSFLVPVLYGIRALFQQALNVKDPIDYMFSDALKQTIDLRETFVYPRMFFQVTGIRKAKERISGFSKMRTGIHAKTGEGESVKHCTSFPVDLSIEFHYQHSDSFQMLQMMEALIVLTFSQTLGFDMVIQNAFEHQVKLQFQDDLTVSQFEIESSANPGTSELVLPFTVYTHIGFITDKPWTHVIDATDPTNIRILLDGDIVTETIGIG